MTKCKERKVWLVQLSQERQTVLVERTGEPGSIRSIDDKQWRKNVIIKERAVSDLRSIG